MKKKYDFFNIKRGSWIHIRKILSDTTLIMFEIIMYLANILLLVQYRFQNHWFDGNTMQKYGQKIKVNQQQVN